MHNKNNLRLQSVQILVELLLCGIESEFRDQQKLGAATRRILNDQDISHFGVLGGVGVDLFSDSLNEDRIGFFLDSKLKRSNIGRLGDGCQKCTLNASQLLSKSKRSFR